MPPHEIKKIFKRKLREVRSRVVLGLATTPAGESLRREGESPLDASQSSASEAPAFSPPPRSDPSVRSPWQDVGGGVQVRGAVAQWLAISREEEDPQGDGPQDAQALHRMQTGSEFAPLSRATEENPFADLS